MKSRLTASGHFHSAKWEKFLTYLGISHAYSLVVYVETKKIFASNRQRILHILKCQNIGEFR